MRQVLYTNAGQRDMRESIRRMEHACINHFLIYAEVPAEGEGGLFYWDRLGTTP